MTEPHIIHTLDEVEALPRSTAVIDRFGMVDQVSAWCLPATGKVDPRTEMFLPAMVILTGEQVRDAQETLKEETS